MEKATNRDGECDVPLSDPRPLQNVPLFVLQYFAPCISFGEPYRRELAIRRREPHAAAQLTKGE